MGKKEKPHKKGQELSAISMHGQADGSAPQKYSRCLVWGCGFFNACILTCAGITHGFSTAQEQTSSALSHGKGHLSMSPLGAHHHHDALMAQGPKGAPSPSSFKREHGPNYHRKPFLLQQPGNYTQIYLKSQRVRPSLPLRRERCAVSACVYIVPGVNSCTPR